MNNPANTIKQRIASEQLQLLYQSAALSSLFSLLNAGIVFTVLWNHLPHLFILSWLAALLLITFLRLTIYKLYWLRGNSQQSPQRWLRLYLFGSLSSGAIWGLLCYIAATGTEIWVQAFVGFISAGLCASSVFTMSALRITVIPYLLLILVPLIAGLLQQTGQAAFMLGLAATLLLVILIRAATRIHYLQLHTLRQRLETDDLFTFLQSSRKEAEKLRSKLSHEASDYEQLRDAREELFERALDPLCIIGRDGHIDLANPALQKLLGIGIGELRARRFTDFVVAEDRDKVNIDFGKIEQGERTLQCRCRMQRSDGKPVSLLWHWSVHEGRVYASGHRLAEKKTVTTTINP